jgi:hypothetical protein
MMRLAGGGGGKGRAWRDGDPSRVEPTEVFDRVEEPAGPDRDDAPPHVAKQGRYLT